MTATTDAAINSHPVITKGRVRTNMVDIKKEGTAGINLEYVFWLINRGRKKTKSEIVESLPSKPRKTTRMWWMRPEEMRYFATLWRVRDAFRVSYTHLGRVSKLKSSEPDFSKIRLSRDSMAYWKWHSDRSSRLEGPQASARVVRSNCPGPVTLSPTPLQLTANVNRKAIKLVYLQKCAQSRDKILTLKSKKSKIKHLPQDSKSIERT